MKFVFVNLHVINLLLIIVPRWEWKDFLRFLFELDIVDESTQLQDLRAQNCPMNDERMVHQFYIFINIIYVLSVV